MAAQNFLKLEQRRGGVAKRKASVARAASSLDSAVYAGASGCSNSSSSSSSSSSCRSLELVSKESFRQRLEGMSSSSCHDCLSEHHKDTTTHLSRSAVTAAGSWSTQRLSKSNRVKRNSPMVVCLTESIRLAEAKSRARASTSSTATSISQAKKANCCSRDDRLIKEGKEEKFTSVSFSSSTSVLHSSLSASGTRIPSNISRMPGKGLKNFNTFLSAVERVHRKDDQPSLSVQNLDLSAATARLLSPTSVDRIEEGRSTELADAFRESVLGETVLNNRTFVGHGGNISVTDNARTTFAEKNNIDVICNDLHSCKVDRHIEVCEDSDPSESSHRHSSLESSDMEAETLPEEEREFSDQKLNVSSEEADEYAMRHRELPPHECPECLSAYFAYTHYYAQGSKFLKIEVLDRDEETSRSYDTPDSMPDSVFEYPPTEESSAAYADVKGKLRVSHFGQTNRQSPPAPFTFHRHIDTVSLDLTGSDVTFTVERHSPDATSTPPGVSTRQTAAESHPPIHLEFYHNFYCAMFGFVPCVPGYCFTPAFYFMFPVWSIPKIPMMAAGQPPRTESWSNLREDCNTGLNGSNTSFEHGSMTPPRRPWISLNKPDATSPVVIYTVMCYNVLCDKYATRQLYGYCPSWALNWEFRKKNIFQEICQCSADIINLQEVETEQFYDFFLPGLKAKGYEGIFSPKSRARTMTEADRKHVDGCAIFFKHSKFSLIKEHLVEFNQVAIETAEGSEDMINRVMTKDNIGLAALLRTKDSVCENGVPAVSAQLVLVATCHIHWDPECCDVKLIQTMMLMNKLKSIMEETQAALSQQDPGASSLDCGAIPLILCGDLNSLPESGVVEYLSLGRISTNHRDFKDIGYEDSLRKLSSSGSKDTYSHSFRLLQAYSTDVMPYTNYTYDFRGTIDYIFYSRDTIRPLGVLGPLDQEWFRQNRVLGCPNPLIPSDHLPLLVEFEMHLPSAAAPSDIPATSPPSPASSNIAANISCATSALSTWGSSEKYCPV